VPTEIHPREKIYNKEKLAFIGLMHVNRQLRREFRPIWLHKPSIILRVVDVDSYTAAFFSSEAPENIDPKYPRTILISVKEQNKWYDLMWQLELCREYPGLHIELTAPTEQLYYSKNLPNEHQVRYLNLHCAASETSESLTLASYIQAHEAEMYIERNGVALSQTRRVYVRLEVPLNFAWMKSMVLIMEIILKSKIKYHEERSDNGSQFGGGFESDYGSVDEGEDEDEVEAEIEEAHTIKYDESWRELWHRFSNHLFMNSTGVRLETYEDEFLEVIDIDQDGNWSVL
jgi:hypothetical protein